MIIYIDSDCRCHLENDGTMQEVETNAFDGKCPEYIEGFRFVPEGQTWTRSDGVQFNGEMITPAVDLLLLETYQTLYERMSDQQEDMQNALEILGVSP